jgi:hypothetical protein
MMLDATSENRAHGWPAEGEIGRRDRQRRRRIASRALLLAMGITLATGRPMAAVGGSASVPMTPHAIPEVELLQPPMYSHPCGIRDDSLSDASQRVRR